MENIITSSYVLPDSGPKYGRAVDGQIGRNLIPPTISNYGLVGRLLGNVGNGLNSAVCKLLGPDFLQILLNYNDCPNKIKVRLPTKFRSYEDFCAFHNSACPSVRKCLTARVARIQIKLHGIVEYYTLIGRCCARCAGRYVF